MIMTLLLHFSLSAFASGDLLQSEPTQKALLVQTAIPKHLEKCECTQKHSSAAQKGELEALAAVADCLSAIAENSCKKDPAAHASWLQAAATRGHTLSQFGLAYLYYYGSGVKADLTKAADWWAQSARQKLPAGFFMLAKAYEEGAGRKQDPKRALELYKEAQKLGYERAAGKVEELSK